MKRIRWSPCSGSLLKLCFATMQDQFAAAVGTAQPPDTSVLVVIAGTMLYVNANLYMLMLTLVYTFLFGSLGLPTPSFPQWLQKRLPLQMRTQTA